MRFQIKFDLRVKKTGHSPLLREVEFKAVVVFVVWPQENRAIGVWKTRKSM